MTFKEFMPLIHKGFTGEIYLVEPTLGSCTRCIGRLDFYSRAKDLEECYPDNVEVCGIHPYRDNAIIIEYKINKINRKAR